MSAERPGLKWCASCQKHVPPMNHFHTSTQGLTATDFIALTNLLDDYGIIELIGDIARIERSKTSVYNTPGQNLTHHNNANALEAIMTRLKEEEDQ